MRIFLTGATGLIGKYFFSTNPRTHEYEIFGTSRNDWPEENLKALRYHEACSFDELDRYREMLKRFRPDVIVNAGSEGNVDAVQKNPAAALKSNYEFPLFLLEEARRIRARFVHFSSNAVYDGEQPPYRESSPMKPAHLYGELKMKVDVEIRRSPAEWVILRPIVTYGWNFPSGRKNPVSQFLPMMLERKPLKLVDDQFENPVYAGDVAAILWKCIETGFSGELNIGGGDNGMSRFEWMKTVAEVFDIKDAPLEPVSMSAFQTLTPRPRDTRFDIGKLTRDLRYHPATVREGAEAMKGSRQP